MDLMYEMVRLLWSGYFRKLMHTTSTLPGSRQPSNDFGIIERRRIGNFFFSFFEKSMQIKGFITNGVPSEVPKYRWQFKMPL